MVYTRTSLGDRIDVTGAGADNYWIAPGCKIVGELSWLNTYVCDVTMVYDAANANAVTELYIAMDPDITPVAPADPGDMTAAKKTLTITNLAQNGVATVQVTYTSTAALTAGAAVAPGTDFTSIVLNIERVNEFGQWENFASQTWATGSLATPGNNVALAPALNNIQTVGTRDHGVNPNSQHAKTQIHSKKGPPGISRGALFRVQQKAMKVWFCKLVASNPSSTRWSWKCSLAMVLR